MLIRLACKLYNSDARYFLDPILMSERVSQIVLYRNLSLGPLTKEIHKKLTGRYNNSKAKFLIRQLELLLNKPKADLYVAIYEIPHGILILLAAKINNKPSVVSIIGNPKYELRNRGIRGTVTKLIYKYANVLTVTGNESKKFLIEQKKVKAEKIFILPNSIPIDEFYHKSDIEYKYDLITMGRISPEKGLFNLVDVVFILKKRLPTIKVGIAGKGQLLKELKDRIEELNLSSNIHLLGFVDDPVDFLNRGKLFISTSYTEGLPRTAIQSMACGTPVVALEVGDMSDLIIHNKTGILHSKEFNKIKLSNQIYDILLNNEKINKFQNMCISEVDQKYNHQVANQTWENIFKYLNIEKSQKGGKNTQ